MANRIAVRHGSLTDGEADCDVLVNASNTLLKLGTGVSGAIRKACGAGYQADLDRILSQRAPGGLEPASVVLTHAGEHPRAKWVAHVAVMDYRPGYEHQALPTLERVREASQKLWTTLERIEQPSLSVAMAVLGAGVGGLGLRASAAASAQTLLDHLASRNESRIARVVFHGFDVLEYANLFDELGRFFPLDEAGVPAELQRYVEAVRRGEA